MKKILAYILLLLAFAENAFCGTVQMQFKMRSGAIINGKIVCPDNNNKKVMVVFVNHRVASGEDNFNRFGLFTEKLLAEGVSCCFFDNRLLHDSTRVASWTDMADDAEDVYGLLKNNETFNDYRIGFAGASEQAASALVSASKVSSPAFLIQICGDVIPEIENTISKMAYFSDRQRTVFTEVMGMAFSDYTSLLRDVFVFVRDKDVPDYRNAVTSSPHENLELYKQQMTKLFEESQKGIRGEFIRQITEKYSSKLKANQKELFSQLIATIINKYSDGENVGPQLLWYAKPYYKDVECPILYIVARDDASVLCSPNLVSFEKIMYGYKKKNFNTAIVDATHNLVLSSEEREHHYNLEHEIDNAKTHGIYDVIITWLVDKVM